MQTVVPPDLEMFLCGYLRVVLGTKIEVDNREPSDFDGGTPYCVVRDDGGQKTGLTTFDRSVGISIYAGNRQSTLQAGELARRAFAALTSPTIAYEKGSPIAAVVDDGCNGPYRVTDQHDSSKCYMTVEYSVVGAIED